MRILVTGGLGFIGHNVVVQLAAQGHDVRIVDNETDYGIIPFDEMQYIMSERKQKIPPTVIKHLIDVESSVLRHVFEQFVPDVIVHLASFPRQKVVNANPQLGSRVMSEGLLNLLELAIKHQVRKFVYVSSSMVYGDFADQVKEDAPCNPQGQYGILKLAGEWLVRDYARRTGLSHIIVRPSAVYGPYDVEDRVVSKFLLTAMRGGEIQVNGPDEVLDFTYVDDAASGIVSAALTESATWGTYNITRGVGHSLLAAAELAVQIAGKGTIKINDRDLNFPSRSSSSIGAARRDIDYKPKFDIEEGFENYYRWLSNSVYWSEKTV
jgi:nucleoside-diphosphate-sugar epimerase